MQHRFVTRRYILFVFSFCLLILRLALAEEVTILYSGETHAMLYPCHCPVEPDGGIARRGAQVKQLRGSNSNILLLDSGGFFAGGLMDEYMQSAPLDTKRTLVNLKAMELMKYDAVAIGDNEFNFGRDFLLEQIDNTGLAFLSCNAGLGRPFIIKEVAGIRFGIIGLTNPAVTHKAAGIKFIDPKPALEESIGQLKKDNADIIILLSQLGEAEDLKLIKDIGGIDILIVGHSRNKDTPYDKIGPVLVLRPSWQGRKLGKLSLTIKDKKISGYKVEEVRLSDKITDDPEMLAILPRCFSDANCKREGAVGVCSDAASMQSRCVFTDSAKIKLTVIEPKPCRACVTESQIQSLKAKFPGLETSRIYYPGSEAEKIIKGFDIRTLPAFLFDKAVENEPAFRDIKDNTEPKGNFYLLKPQVTGVSYYLDRKEIRNRFDWFASLYGDNTPALLNVMKEFKPEIHFLAIEKNGRFEAARGAPEVEEYLRSVCVQKYYPAKFWDYLGCRAKSIGSSWWEDCLEGTDTDKIRSCAREEEGRQLLKENISLNREFQVITGPVYLLDNREIFGLDGVPKKEEFENILKSR